MSSSTVVASKFNASLLTTSDIKKLDNGSSQVYINYDSKKLRVQGPQLSVPYDSGDYQGNQKFKAQFSLKGADKNARVASFKAMLEAIDDFVIDVATKNAGKWFKMPGASRDMIKILYTPSLKYSKDKATGEIKTEYPPTFSVALKQRNGAFDAECFDDKGVPIEGVSPVEVLRRGAEVVPVADATGIWVADKKFGLTWKLYQALVKVPAEGGVSRGFVGVDEDTGVSLVEESALLSAVLPAAKAAPAPVPAAAPAEDEEDEEEDEDEEEESDHETPAPPVPVAAVKPKPAPVAAPAAAPVPAATAAAKPAGRPLKKAAAAAPK
jgi:hypothetical protein